MWACTSCFSPNPICPDKTLTVVWLLGSSRSGTGPGVGDLFVSPSVVASGPAGLGLGQVLVTVSSGVGYRQTLGSWLLPNQIS